MVKLKDGFTGERALVLPRIIVDKMEEDPLTSMLHITDIGYYPKAKHHFRERKEPINQYVFIYCIDGAGSYRIGDQEYTVSANQYFILPAGVPHSYASNKSTPWTIYWIHFKGILAPFYAKDANRPMDISPNNTPASVRGSTCLKRYSIHSKMVIATRTCAMRFLCFTFIWERYAMSSNIVMQAPMRQKMRE